MKLYIFRCRTRPKMFGATRYETASNLPTEKCPGGWEFFQRVDLSPRGTLRYAVDTVTVRRQVEGRGWHVWDETPRGEDREVPAAKAQPLEEKRPAAEPQRIVLKVSTDNASPLLSPESRKQKVAEEAVAAVEEHKQSIPTENLSSPGIPEKVLEAAASTLPRDYNFVRPIADLLSSNPPHAKARPIERPARVSAEKTTRVPVEKVTPAPVEKVAPAPEKPATRAPRLPVQHQVVWFDIPVRDIDRAIRFYSAVLGKPLKKEQAGPGTAVVLLPHDEGSVGGSLVQNMDARPSDSGPLLYLNTQGRLEEVLIAVERHGGKVLAETHSIAPFGFRAIVLDSEGNRIALHSM